MHYNCRFSILNIYAFSLHSSVQDLLKWSAKMQVKNIITKTIFLSRNKLYYINEIKRILENVKIMCVNNLCYLLGVSRVHSCVYNLRYLLEASRVHFSQEVVQFTKMIVE